METIVVRLPGSLDLAGVMTLSGNLQTLPIAKHFVFDFGSVGLTEPFGMLVASSELRRIRDRYPDARFSAKNYKHMSYAAHMGFFKAFGLDFGNAPGEAKGSDRYLPLTTLACSELIDRAARNGTEIGDEVEGESARLAQMLCGQESGALVDTLSYSIRELMRNVVEHSEGAEIWLCAQYWPSKARVEVAIADMGIGLRESLKNNPHLDCSDDKRAVNYALMPAVSGKAYKGARNRQKGPWANSGFGLYMTNRICRNGGNFFIASCKTGMLLTKKSEGKRYFDCDFHGTAVRMVIRTAEIPNLRDALDVYRREGYEIQSRYREIISIDPSSASLMLSEDFDLSVWDKILAKLKGRH